MRALIIGGILQAAAIASYATLAFSGTSTRLFALVMAGDNFSISFAGVALVAYMSSLTNIGYTATQYALLSSTYAWLGKILKGFSGAEVENLSTTHGLIHGYGIFFIACGLTGLPAVPLSEAHGVEGPRVLAVIDEDWCIGCTLCIKACPVDSIVGLNKQMHTVVEDQCTGCELCIPVCPVDCISLVPAHADTPAPTGWAAWPQALADQAQERYAFHKIRVVRAKAEHDARLQAKAEHKLAHLEEASKLTDKAQLDQKRAVIEAALARARARREPPKA